MYAINFESCTKHGNVKDVKWDIGTKLRFLIDITIYFGKVKFSREEHSVSFRTNVTDLKCNENLNDANTELL